jgi:Cu(I)/Ag(I) efflux system membrane fusion protein
VPQLVTLGRTTHDRVEIVSGLSVGDTVVASATFLVDAESNLGALFGGMGNMPGMDMTAPSSTSPTVTPPARRDTNSRTTPPPRMPGMGH